MFTLDYDGCYYLSAENGFVVRTQFDLATMVRKHRQQRLNSIPNDTKNRTNKDKMDKNLIHSVLGIHEM